MSTYVADHKVVPGRPLRSIVNYARPYARRYIAGAALSVLFVTLTLVTPLVIKGAVGELDAFFQNDPGQRDSTALSQALWFYFFVLIGVSVCSGLARFGQRSLMIGASRHFEYDLRNDYFAHIQRLSKSFFNRTKTGDIMARATNDLNFVRMFVGPGVMGTVDLIRMPFTLGLMIYLSPYLTLIALAPLPVVSFFVYRIIMYTHHKSNDVQEKFSDVTARAQENIAGARVVKAYGIAHREVRDFKNVSTEYMRESFKLSVVQSMIWPVIGVLVGVTIVLILWQGGTLVINRQLGLDDFSAFIACLLLVAFPLAEFGWIMTVYQRGSAGMKRISQVMNEEPAVRDTEDTRNEITHLQGHIKFDHVTFAYDGEPVLYDISFEAPAGQTLAIVGPTGSGKSTLVSLLTRLVDPTEGTVYLDGVDARQVPLDTIRAAIGYVPQDTFLFSDSVGANLTLGAPNATIDAMNHACDVAQFSETVERLPRGYDTLLGERGVNLSGGQKQRLAIARAVIRDPRILVLDDALASVDAHTEEEILKGMKEVAKTRTTVIIAHRISAVQHADQILVLEDGRIVERGNHASLVNLRGMYADMYERQLLEEEIEEAS